MELRTDREKRSVINWPEQHYENGVGKNNRTSRRFKSLVRIIKALCNEMSDAGISATKPIPTILTIKQSFTKISCVMRTEEMQSHSCIEGFKLEKDEKIRQLAYSYTSKPRLTVAERSAPHDGAMVLDIIGTPVNKVKGKCWTERKTTGEVALTFREKKMLDDFPSDMGGTRCQVEAK